MQRLGVEDGEVCFLPIFFFFEVHANKTLTKIADEEKKIQKNNLRGFKRLMSNINTTVNTVYIKYIRILTPNMNQKQ